MYSDPQLYLSDNISPRAKRGLLSAVKKGSLRAPYFVIALSPEPDQELLIYPAFEIRSDRVDRDGLHVVGLGRGYFHALGVILRIAEEVYAQTGDARMRDYFLKRRQG